MSLKKEDSSIKKNFIMNILLTLSSFIFPIITFPYISRILLPIGMGKVSFATSIINYFCLFAQLGIPYYGIRACACVRDDKDKLTRTVHELLVINLALGIVSYIILGVCILNIPRLCQEKELYFVISITIVLNSLGMEWMYKGLEKYSYITKRSILFKFSAVGMMFAFIHEQDDYILYGAVTIFAASASNILNFINVRKYIYIRNMHGYCIKRHLKPILVFFAMACATTIYTNLDNVMLGFMTTDIDVGYYNAAVKIKTVLVSIVISLGTVLLPRASYYIENKQLDEFKRISEKAFNFVLIIAIPMMVFFVLYAKETIYFLSGSEYENAIIPMMIIMPTLVFIGMTNILGLQMLVPLGKEKYVLYSEIAGAIVDLLLNALLIPVYKSSGAAFGTFVAEIMVFVVQFLAIKSYAVSFLKNVQFIKMGIGIVLSVLTSSMIRILSLSDFFTLFVSSIIFFGVYLLVLVLLKEEIMILIVNDLCNKVKRRK